jgi:hypothetical protein
LFSSYDATISENASIKKAVIATAAAVKRSIYLINLLALIVLIIMFTPDRSFKKCIAAKEIYQYNVI